MYEEEGKWNTNLKFKNQKTIVKIENSVIRFQLNYVIVQNFHGVLFIKRGKP